ncbi:MAG TPA: site-2 protease family protein [Candidatus Limnocylindrales bacterium]|nr:site-2 protease family protein [Candidatus Limnocylindrales bacterium]
MSDGQELLIKAVVILVMLGIAFPVHEFSHALAAYRLGDSTARYLGRLTLDPRVHFDPMGGLLMIISVLAGVGIGWAKPTPYNPYNLRGGRWGEALVSLAGPISNLVLAIAGAIPLRFLIATHMDAEFFVVFFSFFVQINLLLMVFNLIPIPPLDGSKLLYAALDAQTERQVRPVLDQYGMFILLALILLPNLGGPDVIGAVFGAVIEPLERLLIGI